MLPSNVAFSENVLFKKKTKPWEVKLIEHKPLTQNVVLTYTSYDTHAGLGAQSHLTYVTSVNSHGFRQSVDGRRTTPSGQHGGKETNSPTERQDGKMEHARRFVAMLMSYCLQRRE